MVNGGGCAKRFDFFFYLEKKILDLYIFFPFSARWSKLKLVAMVIFFSLEFISKYRRFFIFNLISSFLSLDGKPVSLNLLFLFWLLSFRFCCL